MGGVADPLVADQHLCLVGDLGPRQVPEADLVLAPSVDLDVHHRGPFEGHVVGERDHCFVAAARRDVHVLLDLFGLERVAVRLRLHQRRPQLPGALHPDDPVGALRGVAMGQRHLGERLHATGGRAERGGEAASELGHLGHHRQQDGGGPHLALLVALERRDREQPGGPPGVVLGERLPGRLGEGDLLPRRTRAAAARLGRHGGGARSRIGDHCGPICGRARRDRSIGAGGRRLRGSTGSTGSTGSSGSVRLLRSGGSLRRPGFVGFPVCLPVDVDAEVRGEPGQTGLVSLAHGTELPLLAPAVELAEDEGRLRARALDGEPDEGFAGPVRDRHPQVVEVPEAGAAVLARRHHDPYDVFRNRGQVHADAVLVAVVGRGLAEQLHAPVVGRGVVVEVEVVLAADLAVLVQEQHGDIGVTGPGGAGPAQTDDHRAGVLAEPGQADVRAL